MSFGNYSDFHAVYGLLFISTLVIAIVQWFRYSKQKRPVDQHGDFYTNIKPLLSFNWAVEAPIKLRPFRPKYHLTMALENTTLEDELIPMDNTYLERIKLRRQIMADDRDETIACLSDSKPVVDELYTWLFNTYLPLRYPTMFTVTSPSTSAWEKRAPHLQNHVLSESMPLTPPVDPVEALQTISSQVDTDILLLLPSSQDGPYHLIALINTFPSGFSPRAKLGFPLDVIHAPVPGYAAKIGKSMDRYFAALPTGKIVKRANWTVTDCGERLFCLAGTHAPLTSSVDEKGGCNAGDGGKVVGKDATGQEVRIEDCRLRCERQTLFRLPETRALVFAFKTYTYSLDDVKAEEGMAEALAEAIEGMGTGSVPEMRIYKRAAVWGETVCRYLRS